MSEPTTTTRSLATFLGALSQPLVVALVLALILGARAAEKAPPPADGKVDDRNHDDAPLLVFDATLYLNKPRPDDLRRRGLHPAVCHASLPLWKQVQAARDCGGLLILDLEPPPSQVPLKDRGALARRYCETIDKARAMDPALVIGLYNHPFSFPPGKRPDAAAADVDEDNDYQLRTAGDGTLEQGITDRLNVATPAAYFHPGVSWEDWVKVAEAARRRGRASQRPVYVFLNPDYFSRPGNAEDPGQVDVERLGKAIRFCRGRFDGIVFWGGWVYQGKTWVRRPWDDKANWLVALREGGLLKDEPADKATDQ